MTGLSPTTLVLVRISAALASRRTGELRGALEEALARGREGGHAGGARREAEGPGSHPEIGQGEGVDPEEVEEVLLQSYLFLGFPAALGGLALWRKLSGRSASPPRDEGPEDWLERGEDVCARVYGSKYPDLRRNISRLHPEMDRWMVLEGYGKVLGRQGLELSRRELCIVAILAVLDVPIQLYSHLRGALNAGASPEEVEAALEAALRLAPSGDAAGRARETWREVLTSRD